MTGAITVTVTGLKEAMDKLSPAKVDRALNRGMERAMKNASTQAKRNASGRPGPNADSGELRSSITGEVEGTGEGVQGVLGSVVKYSRIHELGGVIVARKAKFLRFKTNDGKWHSVKSVTIPARPYLWPAVGSPFAQRAIAYLIEKELAKALGAK